MQMTTSPTWKRLKPGAMQGFVLSLCLSMYCAVSLTQTAYSETVDPALERQQIIDCLYSNELMSFSPEYCPRVRLDRSRGLVVLYLYRHQKARETDLKIDNVVAARIISKAGHSWVKHVEAHYFSRHDQSRYVATRVDLDTVQDFARGEIDREALLSRVERGEDVLPGLKERYQGLSYMQILTGDFSRSAGSEEKL